jgi:hypothetical protein
MQNPNMQPSGMRIDRVFPNSPAILFHLSDIAYPETEVGDIQKKLPV